MDKELSEKIRCSGGNLDSLRGNLLTEAEWKTATELMQKAWYYRSHDLRRLTEVDPWRNHKAGEPLIDYKGTLLPITSAGITKESLRLGVGVEAAGRRLGEAVSKMLLYGWKGEGFEIKGLLDVAQQGYGRMGSRQSSDWQSDQKGLIDAILEMRGMMYSGWYFGPFTLLYANCYDAYFDNDWLVGLHDRATKTVRSRLREIEGVSDVCRLDFLQEGVVMAQLSFDVITLVEAIHPQLIEWKGELLAVCIVVPRIEVNESGKSGVVWYKEKEV